MRISFGQFKELWGIRFQKIWDGEKEALIFYKNIMQANEHLLGDTRAKMTLEEIKRDEAKHARIAYKLLLLVRRKVKKDGSG